MSQKLNVWVLITSIINNAAVSAMDRARDSAQTLWEESCGNRMMGSTGSQCRDIRDDNEKIDRSTCKERSGSRGLA